MIWLGQITKWNDLSIQELNLNVSLPNENITLAFDQMSYIGLATVDSSLHPRLDDFINTIIGNKQVFATALSQFSEEYLNAYQKATLIDYMEVTQTGMAIPFSTQEARIQYVVVGLPYPA